MKTSFAIVGIILLIGGGYYFYYMQRPSETNDMNGAPQGKIDINAVCEGALAYITFESGAAAEAWVAECKEGKHPEAIEQWRAQMGITDDRAI